jgi:hypothetical protein
MENLQCQPSELYVISMSFDTSLLAGKNGFEIKSVQAAALQRVRKGWLGYAANSASTGEFSSLMLHSGLSTGRLRL